MSFKLFSRVILVRDLLDENLVAGDMGTVVEHHPATKNYPEVTKSSFFPVVAKLSPLSPFPPKHFVR